MTSIMDSLDGSSWRMAMLSPEQRAISQKVIIKNGVEAAELCLGLQTRLAEQEVEHWHRVTRRLSAQAKAEELQYERERIAIRRQRAADLGDLGHQMALYQHQQHLDELARLEERAQVAHERALREPKPVAEEPLPSAPTPEELLKQEYAELRRRLAHEAQQLAFLEEQQRDLCKRFGPAKGMAMANQLRARMGHDPASTVEAMVFGGEGLDE